jgi:hypothetical protein
MLVFDISQLLHYLEYVNTFCVNKTCLYSDCICEMIVLLYRITSIKLGIKLFDVFLELKCRFVKPYLER